MHVHIDTQLNVCTVSNTVLCSRCSLHVHAVFDSKVGECKASLKPKLVFRWMAMVVWCSAGGDGSRSAMEVCGCFSLATYQLPFLLIVALTVNAKIGRSRIQSEHEPKHAHMAARTGNLQENSLLSLQATWLHPLHLAARPLCNLYFKWRRRVERTICIFVFWWVESTTIDPPLVDSTGGSVQRMNRFL